MDNATKQMIECHLNMEFECVYCNKKCKHKDAFGKLDCFYHPGTLETIEYFGNMNSISNFHHIIRNSNTSRMNITKWSCCGNKHYDSPMTSFIGIGNNKIEHNRNSKGCMRCDHQSIQFQQNKTPKIEFVPVCLINTYIFPLDKYKGSMIRVDDQFGIIDKVASTVPITRFE
jgi:hypothetical protein